MTPCAAAATPAGTLDNLTGSRMFRRFLPLVPWFCLAGLSIAAVSSWLSNGLFAELLSTDSPGPDRVERIRAALGTSRVGTHLAYVLLVMAEVVIAPVPGLFLYAPGGLLFGPWLGGLLALIGNVAGAGVSAGLTRSLRSTWLDHFSRNPRIEAAQGLLERRGGWMIFLLRVNPLTSSDLLSYAAGLTRIPIWKIMFATGCGMAPLCFAQSWISDGVFNRWPGLLRPLIAVTVVYLLVTAWILARLARQLPGNPVPIPLPAEDVRN